MRQSGCPCHVYTIINGCALVNILWSMHELAWDFLDRTLWVFEAKCAIVHTPICVLHTGTTRCGLVVPVWSTQIGKLAAC